MATWHDNDGDDRPHDAGAWPPEWRQGKIPFAPPAVGGMARCRVGRHR